MKIVKSLLTLGLLAPLASWAKTSQKEEAPPPPVWIMREFEHIDGNEMRRKLKEPVLQMRPLTRIVVEQGKRINSVNLDPKRRSDVPMLELLDNGVGMGSSYPRKVMGELIKAMPCSGDTLTILSETEPVNNLDRVIVNPKDTRRIRYIEVTGCLEVTPDACIRDVPAEGRIDFDFGDMQRFFDRCGKAMRKAIDDGKRLSQAQRDLEAKGLSSVHR